jgi:hypothetical protein
MQSMLWTFGDFALVGGRTGRNGPSYSVLSSWLLCMQAGKKPEKKDK